MPETRCYTDVEKLVKNVFEKADFVSEVRELVKFSTMQKFMELGLDHDDPHGKTDWYEGYATALVNNGLITEKQFDQLMVFITSRYKSLSIIESIIELEGE